MDSLYNLECHTNNDGDRYGDSFQMIFDKGWGVGVSMETQVLTGFMLC